MRAPDGKLWKRTVMTVVKFARLTDDEARDVRRGEELLQLLDTVRNAPVLDRETQNRARIRRKHVRFGAAVPLPAGHHQDLVDALVQLAIKLAG